MEKTSLIGHPYGLHRVCEPIGVLPQPAWKLDATPVIYANELLINVERLNIDSASFAQLKEEAKGNEEKIKQKILSIVRERGKMHNPVTGSGGMLIGRVEQIGSHFPHTNLQAGSRIATLVSLTLTPLRLEEIQHVDLKTGQLKVSGKAILFASGPYAVLPEDLPETVALAALDVCGAPAQTSRLVQPDHVVVVLGAGGKSGLLSLYHAWKKAGKDGRVIALEANEDACQEIHQLQMAHEIICVDATNPVAVLEAVTKVTDGKLADLTINCVNVPNTELSSILITREGGLVYFFSMAVRFTAAALGAEGVGKDVQMLIGNGYAKGHAELTIQTLRESKPLRELFVARYASH
ncbi:L-erythro-3,5-diaminohexanoate dehydrogenase [Thermoflavimicrobium dichotomicum]|uniref:L-erythro-3,5-diaminohexanoate dehydrogenase n=1 Tax=Thermoflavimicrobium dichotomicum TaxID=46223 RepID=A0A1I3K7M6_9BACL|nr:L-erythro-3,5-diaminohexanoate dehydrogenase [Thermoflavimicrobium dichotomicum]SFI68521.1 L-erythro-3,5-diaminohexanoate dehydrogenase [Thermoflavimicrobium dichotomicum]